MSSPHEPRIPSPLGRGVVNHHKMEERENLPDFDSHPVSDRQWSKVQDPEMAKYPTTPEPNRGNGNGKPPAENAPPS